MERLTPRVRAVWVGVSLLRAAMLGAVLVGGTYSLSVSPVLPGVPPPAVWGSAAVALAVGACSVAVSWARYDVWRFEVRDDALYIERGVFTRIKTIVPYVRVQHVDTQRGPLERAANLATVVVYTAGSRSADVTIPGLTPERAERLREELRRLAIESEGEDAV